MGFGILNVLSTQLRLIYSIDHPNNPYHAQLISTALLILLAKSEDLHL